MMKKSREQGIEELTLMLLYLTRFSDSNQYCPYEEPSWKGYDFDVLNDLEKRDLLYQPNKTKISYLSEEGKDRARQLLREYGIADKDILERFEFRTIHMDEVGQAAEIERICFPPNEACSPENMRERIERASDLFLVAVDRKTGKIAGFLNGLATNEYTLRDEFFTDASLHFAEGRNIMLTGLDVLPAYRKQGLARELVFEYQRREKQRGRKMLILTCLNDKVKMYRKFGFIDKGISASQWGGVQWHEMICTLNY